MANVGTADLRGADLRDVDVSPFATAGRNYGTWFAGSDLRGADARGVDFTGSLLSEANLEGADLRGANLKYANRLWAARLTGAVYDATTVFHPEFDPEEHGMVVGDTMDVGERLRSDLTLRPRDR